MSSFSIDHFLLSILAEACIPPRPIGRALFWKDLTNVYWEQQTERERAHLFSWIQLNPWYEESLQKEEDTQFFHARYDPDNQYTVHVLHNDEPGSHRAFLKDNRYWTGTTKFIAQEYITSTEKIDLSDESDRLLSGR